MIDAFLFGGPFDFLVKCLLAVVVGSVIGLERETRRKPAGLKTHVLICLGSALLAHMSLEFSEGGDPGRIAAQVVSGIGFIGAGTILHSQRIVKGLTTAATLWIVMALGMLIGGGFIWASLMATVIVALFLYFSKKVMGGKLAMAHYSLTIDIEKLGALKRVNNLVEKFGLYVDYKSFKRREHEMILELNYATTALNQHLFMKRVLELEGVGEVIMV